MRIFFLTGTILAAIPMDEKEQYERTLSKRHPNRGREELQAMAEEHLGVSLSGRQPDWRTATHRDMARELLNRDMDQRNRNNDEFADEMEYLLWQHGRQIPDRQSLYTTISRVRKESGWELRRGRRVELPQVSERDASEQSLMGIVRWVLMQQGNRLKGNWEIEQEVNQILTRNGKGPRDAKHVCNVVSKARRSLRDMTGKDFSAPRGSQAR